MWGSRRGDFLHFVSWGSLKIAGLGQRKALGTQAVSQVQVTGGGGLEEVMVQPEEKGVDL